MKLSSILHRRTVETHDEADRVVGLPLESLERAEAVAERIKVNRRHANGDGYDPGGTGGSPQEGTDP